MTEAADQPYEQIPAEIRDLLDELYTEEGAVMWWNARNKLLDGERARDVARTPEGRERVANLLNALCDGVFL